LHYPSRDILDRFIRQPFPQKDLIAAMISVAQFSYRKALVQRLEARASTLGLRECVLETTQTGLRFYESLGYVKSEQTYPLSLTGLPATLLRKVLEPLKV